MISIKNLNTLILATSLLISCSQRDDLPGVYTVEVSGLKDISEGKLEVVGSLEDYFGRISFNATKERVFELGLSFKSEDSLHFFLPGQGGFLSLSKEQDYWQGRFKYFGLKANIIAKKEGESSSELVALIKLKPLAQGIISTVAEESFPSFDHENNILYFTRDQKIYTSKFSNTSWGNPEKLNFSEQYNDSAPYIIHGGRTLLFTSNRPMNESKLTKKNLWQSSKVKGEWQSPVPLPHPINIDTIGDYHGAKLDNRRVYFISYNREGGYGRSDIYMAARSESGEYEVINLGDDINSDKSEADVFVDPAERYILFASTGRDDSFGADDIYISFKEGENWTKPQNLGPKVNSYAYEYGAWVDPENNQLYFNSYRRGSSDIYRINLDEIEVFKEM